MGQPTSRPSSCSGCGGQQFAPFAIRSDGVTVMQCASCGMGVASVDGSRSDVAQQEPRGEWIDRVLKLAVDARAASGATEVSADRDYRADTGLASADADQQVIEKALRIAGAARQHGEAPDVMAAVGVLENSGDFGAAFGRIAARIGQDGFALIEMRTLDALEDEAPAPLQRFYPTRASVARIAGERGWRVVGAKLSAPEFAPAFIGFVTANGALAARLQTLLDMLLGTQADGLTREERLARLHFNLAHLRHANYVVVHDLSRVPLADLDAALLAPVTRLWAADVQRLHDDASRISTLEASRDEQADRASRWEQLWRGKSEMLDTQTRRFAAKFEIATRDSRQNASQANQAVVYEIRKNSILEARAKSAEARANDAEQRLASTEQRLLAVYGDYLAMQNSAFWRVTAPVRRVVARYPQVARRGKQLARVLWWSAKFKLRANLQEAKRRRVTFAEQQATAREAAEAAIANVRLLPVAGFLPDVEPDVRGGDAWPDDRPLVSVIVPCFNYGHFVREAIASIEAQTFDDIEIIVVEGGSSSPESRQEFVSLIESASHRVRVLLQDQPHRAGGNRNFGISHARGKYVCCLDADDRLEATYIEKAVFLLENYAYDGVTPGLRFFGERTGTYAALEQPELSTLLKANSILTCSVFSRALWKEAGGFRDSDPATGHIHEDWLFWTRLAALGARFLNIQEPLLLYRSHSASLSNGDTVINMETQAGYICQFNADVLTHDALVRATERKNTVVRSPKPLRNVLRTKTRDDARPVIMLTVPCLILGGAERLLSKIVEHLANEGWRVIIVTTVPVDAVHGDTTDWFRPYTGEIYHLPRFLAPDRWTDFTDYLFASHDVSLLWNAGSAFFYDYLPALKHRFPKLRVTDLLFNTIGHTANNRRYASLIDLHLVENAEVRRWLIDAGEAEERIRMIPSGVDLTEFRPARKDRAFLREVGVPEGAIIIGFSGRFSEEKDPYAMIEIARRLPRDLPVTFIMTGTGGMEAGVRQAVANAGFPAGKFIVTGPVEDVKPYLRSYDVLVVPSRIDGRPNVVMEGLASGVAVVASRVGALPEMVENGVTGYLCEPGDYAAFTQRIEELIENPRTLDTFRQNARTFAEKHLDIGVMMRAYAAQFDALLAGEVSLSPRAASENREH